MSSVYGLMSEWQKKAVRFSIEGGEFSVHAPKGALSHSDIEGIRAHKAEIIELLRTGSLAAPLPPLLPQERAGALPLSFAQQRLWFVHQVAPQGSMYHVFGAAKLTGQLDRAALRETVRQLVMRHESLRTVFRVVDGEPSQVVLPHLDAERVWIELSREGMSEPQMRRWMQQEIDRPFDLTRGPLIRVMLIANAPAEHHLLIVVHHIVADGWSIGLLLRELGVLYAAFANGDPSPLPPLPVQYADYALWQRRHINAFEGDLAYWSRQLRGVSWRLALPRDHPRPASRSHAGAMERFIVPKQLTAGLTELARSAGATPFMATLAIFEVLLARVTGQSDFVIATPVAGRVTRETEGLIGFFVNTLALRATVSFADGFDKHLAHTRTVALDAYAHQTVPFDKMIAAVQPERDAAAHTSITQVAFVFHNRAPAVEPSQLPGVVLEPIVLENRAAKTELTLTLVEGEDTLYGSFEYATELFAPATIQALARRFTQLIAAVIEQPRAPLDALDISLPGERQDYRYTAAFLRDRRYWSASVEPLTPVSLSVRAVAASSEVPVSASQRVPARLIEPLDAASREASVCIDDWLTAALTLYVGKVTRTHALCIGIAPASSESHQVLPLDIRLDESADTSQCVADVLRAVHDTQLHGRGFLPHTGWQPQQGSREALGSRIVIDTRPLNPPELHPSTPEKPDSKVELRICVGRSGEQGEMQIAWRGRPQRYQSWELQVHAERFEHFLECLLSATRMRAPFSALPMLSDRERLLVLQRFNDTRRAYASDACVHELVESQAERKPHAVALIDDGRSVTYGELNARANRLARELRRAGVRPEVRVAVCAQRGTELLVAFLAVLKAGGVYVPIDPENPAERIEHMLRDSMPAVLLAHGAASRALDFSNIAPPIIDLVSDAARWESESDQNLAARDAGVTAGSLAYVIYTSGSTGTPKGVMIDHRAVVNYVCWRHRYFGTDSDEVFLQKASISFDLSIAEMLVPLTCGGMLVVVPSGRQHDVDYLCELVQAHSVTTLSIVPSALRTMQSQWSKCASVRNVVSGGEALSESLIADLYASCTNDLRIYNAYGPTETTILVSAYACPREGRLVTVPIGKPMDNASFYVLDEHDQPVPIGAPGELYIGGDCIARGYLNQQALTAERFIPSPFEEVGARLYRTGDLVRWRQDGNLEFLGRIDEQVKIRGFRVELGEIEAQLGRCEGIREAVVALVGSEGDQRLAAYVTLRAGSTIDIEALRAQLKKYLPEYMVPAAFVLLEAMPLTANGKVDRSRLPDPGVHAYRRRPYEAPQGDIEARLAEIWQGLLKVESVGRRDNFFELGGHSLLIVEMIEKMRGAGFAADVRTVFNAPTIAELARELVPASVSEISVPPNLIPLDCDHIIPDMLPLVKLTQEQIDEIVRAVPGGARNVKDVYPLTPAQEGILFHHMMATEGDAYILVSLMAFADRERLDRFIVALQAVSDRHDIMRTAFAWEHLPEPVQVVWRHARIAVEEVHLDGADVAGQLRARFDPRHYRLDLRCAPLRRIFIARDAEHDRWLVLMLNHHLVGDHATLETIFDEVQAHLLGRQSALSAPIPFRNFVAQARLQVSPAEHEAFFREHLHGIDEPTLPFGLVDVRGDGVAVKEATTKLDAQLCRRMRERSRLAGVGAASLCHLAWAMVLARVSGRDDVVFGTVLFGRMQGSAFADRVVGLFINTLPICIRLGRSVLEDLLGTHRALGELVRHEHASLALAQQCSAVAKPAPLFSSLLNFRYRRVPELAPDEAAQVWSGVSGLSGQERTNYPLILSVTDLGEDFSLNAQVCGGIEPERICDLMTTALSVLVDSLEHATDRATLALDVLPAGERECVVTSWNDSAVRYPRDRAVHSIFEERVVAAPHAVAVVSGDTSLTYGALNERANRLANYLRQQGVEPGTYVPIVRARDVDSIVAQLAVLKCGAAYVPIDPEFPPERQRFMIADCGARVVIGADEGHVERDAEGLIWLDLAARAAAIAACSAESTLVAVDGGDAAYVMYTSGSTGKPKGVIVPHRAIGRLVINNWYAPFESSDCVAHGSNPAFDASTFEIWGALLNGARVAVLDHATMLDSEALATAIAQQGVTVMFLTTSLFNQHALGTHAFAGLKCLVVGGEAADPKAMGSVLRAGGPRLLTNGYGPTETTTFATAHWVTEQDTNGATVPIGRPLANTQIYILDRHMRPVPIGAIGEIYIGGDGVALGYLHRPELTRERFIADPFSSRSDGRLYRTGDLGRWRADGSIDYLGRHDQQVKLRGFRIELGEIESCLTRHPAVKEAAVLARPDEAGGKQLVAYCTYSSERPPAVEELRSHVARSLPDYMTPAAFVLLDSMPLTSNGKLNRNALPAPDIRAFQYAQYEAPQGELETALAAIWESLLKVHPVGRRDNFFELGGHSLLAVRLISHVRQVLGRALQMHELFDAPTVQELARRLATAGTAKVTEIGKADRTRNLPLSLAQQRLWFIDQLQGLGAAYNIPGGVRLHGLLDEDALRATLDAIVARHEILRTAFQNDNGNPVQLIDSDVRFPLQVLDLRGLPPNERQAHVLHQSREESRTSFDLTRAPLIRGRLLRVADDEHVLLINMHHIVSDGWSLGVFFREMSVLYAGFREKLPNTALAPLGIQYADYAAWERQWMTGPVLQEQLDYWKQQLTGAPVLLSLPTDRPRPQIQSNIGATVEFSLGTELTGKLKAFSRRHDATLFMTLITGWFTLMSKLSGQDDIVVGAPVANRQRVELEELIGFFVNTLALRAQIDPRQSVEALLRQVKQMTLSAYAHQETPFEQVVEVVQPPRSLSHDPIFQVLFVLQNTPQSELRLPGLRIAPVAASAGAEPAAPHRNAKFDLLLSMQETGQDIHAALNYALDLFDHATVESWVGFFKVLLEGMVANPAAEIGDLALMDARQIDQVIRGFRSADVAPPVERLLHQGFERQVTKTPNDFAVLEGDAHVTYAELNRRANRLAHFLRARGVGPDSRVAICVERSIELIVGVLGILKAGGAYVPLDPAYPADRLRYMLHDAAPSVLLTEERLRSTLPEAVAAVVVELDRDWPAIARLPQTNPEVPDLRPEHLAYVIYTSGSTGQPKGVAMEHGALVNLMAWHRVTLPVPRGQRTLQFAALGFDVACQEIFATLSEGGQLVIIDELTRRDARALVQFIRERDVQRLFLPFVALQQLADAALASGTTMDSLEHVVTAGEQLVVVPALREFFRQHGQARLHNHYGPTESHVVTAFTLSEHVDDWPVLPSIGSPIANAQIYILDDRRRPVPVGVVGELHIGGAALARGYLNMPERTSERFIRVPFLGADERLYKTGDLARWRRDGTIDYVGRNDTQTKIRGFRVELGEIEALLSRHPTVRDVAVVVREDVAGDRRIVAYFKSATEGEVDPESLRTHLETTLPEYMIPRAYVQLESLPLTPTGKVDRNALPAPPSGAQTSAAYESPVGEIEETIAAIWQELLAVEHVSRRDNFFDLGGHSLLVVKLFTRLEQLGFSVTLATLIQHPTVMSLARSLKLGEAPETARNPVPLRPEGAAHPLFLVHEVSGDVLPYVPLARLLRNDVPVYGLQSIGLPDLTSIEMLAAKHVEAIRSVQPHGPYRLAGWSFGAYVAYEIAYQLIGADEAVEFVGMIDVAAPSGRPMRARDDIALLLGNVHDNSTIDEDTLRELRTLTDLSEVVERCKAGGFLPADFTLEKARKSIELLRILPNLWSRYTPMPLPISLHLFDSEEALPAHMSRDWAALVGPGLHRHVIGGTHRSMMKPPLLQRLAASMSDALTIAVKRQYTPARYAPLVGMQSSAPGAVPVFCIPGAGASVTCFLPLSEALGNDHVAYGLQPRGLEGTLVPHSSVAAAADCYLAAIRSLLIPGRPCHLLGHSFGGWIAFEMARRLAAEGIDVAPVVLLDTEVPSPQHRRRHFGREDMLMELIATLDQGAPQALQITRQDLERLDNESQLQLLLQRMIAAGMLPKASGLDAVSSMVRVFAANLYASYMPSAPFAGEIVFFEPQQRADGEESGIGWEKFASRVRFHTIDANHMTLLTGASVRAIARTIRGIWTGTKAPVTGVMS